MVDPKFLKIDTMALHGGQQPDLVTTFYQSNDYHSYTDFSYNVDDVLIGGRETTGLPREVADACHEAVTIPMYGNARSLNVAITAAMVMGELLRQMR